MAGQQEQIYDCIIVGAGYSGLAAAKLLTEHGSSPKILVLEARGRVGGRVKTVHLDDGNYWDVGGSFLGVQQDMMYKLAEEYGVETHAPPPGGKIVFFNRGRARKYSGLIPPLRPWELLDVGLFLRKFEKLIKSVDVNAPWKHPNAEDWDTITAEEWVNRRMWTKAGRATVDMTFQAIFGKAGKEISLLHAVFVLKTAVSITVALNAQDGLQRDLMKGGAMAIPDKIRQAIGGDEVVRLGEPVQGVKYDEGELGCHVTTTKGQYRTKRIIFATPPEFAAKVQFNPPLPTEKKTLLEAMQLGAYSKVFATYKTPFWWDRGLRGECTSLEGYISVAFDASLPEPGSLGKMMGFITGSKAREFAGLSDTERRRIALNEFAGLLGKEALDAEAFIYHSMLHEKWSAGCPLASPPPGIWTSCGEWIRKPVGPIHWAGTETSTRFYGYMEGAVDAGRRAAKEVIEGLKMSEPEKRVVVNGKGIAKSIVE
jgi:monoamine oxidase